MKCVSPTYFGGPASLPAVLPGTPPLLHRGHLGGEDRPGLRWPGAPRGEVLDQGEVGEAGAGPGHKPGLVGGAFGEASEEIGLLVVAVVGDHQGHPVLSLPGEGGAPEGEQVLDDRQLGGGVPGQQPGGSVGGAGGGGGGQEGGGRRLGAYLHPGPQGARAAGVVTHHGGEGPRTGAPQLEEVLVGGEAVAMVLVGGGVQGAALLLPADGVVLLVPGRPAHTALQDRRQEGGGRVYHLHVGARGGQDQGGAGAGGQGWGRRGQEEQQQQGEHLNGGAVARGVFHWGCGGKGSMSLEEL